MALLILWEVDHGRRFPSTSAASEANLLMGFTKRLRARLRTDDPEATWPTCRDVHAPLAPGLPTSHHMRWSLKVVAPADGCAREWYDEFVRRWKEYLQSLTDPALQGTGRTRAAEDLAPAKRRRTAPPAPRPNATPAAVAAAAAAADASRRRPRASTPAPDSTGPPSKRQATMSSWLQPRRPPPPEHGRAAQVPPT